MSLRREQSLGCLAANVWQKVCMLGIELKGKRALVAGVADDGGLGWGIAKALAEAGASVCVGTWPPALGIFETLLRRGKLEESAKFESGEGALAFERVYPLDAEYDSHEELPTELRENKRYKDQGDVSIDGLRARVLQDFGENSLDVVVHCLANGPEVKKPLLETSRRGYLAASSASAYSFVSMVQRFGPLVRKGGSFLSLTYIAADRVIPGYGGGMSSAKAALESDTRVLAYEAGRRWGHRVNCISAGPYASRAASAIGFIGKMIEHAKHVQPLPEAITAREVGTAAAFLLSPLASGITGHVVYVDKGFHAMGGADLG
jgi:enoyl-[acyl-carrier protein] reductase I